mgnify:CR=1 FL=1
MGGAVLFTIYFRISPLGGDLKFAIFSTIECLSACVIMTSLPDHSSSRWIQLPKKLVIKCTKNFFKLRLCIDLSNKNSHIIHGWIDLEEIFHLRYSKR